MTYLVPDSIEAVLERRRVAQLALLGLAALGCGLAAEREPAAALGLFAAMLAAGWMLAATALTHFCGAHGLALEPPALHGDFHALSRFRVGVRLANSRRRSPALFLIASLDTLIDGTPLPSPPKFVGRLAARESVRLEWDITARKRGEYELCGVRVRAAFPGSLGAHECRFRFSRKALALPAIYRLAPRSLELLQGRRQAGGRLHATPAAMEEFTGVRDYRPGDNPRHVHFALSLRRPDFPAELVVREFEDPSDDDVCVVLDSAIAPAEREDELLLFRHEKSLCFAVALCRLLIERKYRVRFVAHEADGAKIDLLLTRTARDVAQLEARLSRLKPIARAEPILTSLERESRRSNATVLFVSLRDTARERVRRRLAMLTVTPDLQAVLVREVVGL